MCICNMALTANSAHADQSYVDVCLLALESHSTPALSRSLHAQAATVGNEFTCCSSWSCIHSPAILFQSLHPVEMLNRRTNVICPSQ